jgi:hypothetical protein
MKLPASILAMLFCTAPLLSGQGVPFISDIESVSASHPGGVTVTGGNLGLVWQASLDGAVVPILHQTNRRLVLDPGPWAPGFSSLELDHITGTVTGTVEFLPSLKVRRGASNDPLPGAIGPQQSAGNPAHDMIQVRLNPGDSGAYWIYYSLETFNNMQFRPGIYYGLWLDPTAPSSGLYSMGLCYTDEPVTFPKVRIPDMSMIGALRMQALCWGQSGELCFTNLAIPRGGHDLPAGPGYTPIPTWR